MANLQLTRRNWDAMVNSLMTYWERRRIFSRSKASKSSRRSLATHKANSHLMPSLSSSRTLLHQFSTRIRGSSPIAHTSSTWLTSSLRWRPTGTPRTSSRLSGIQICLSSRTLSCTLAYQRSSRRILERRSLKLTWQHSRRRKTTWLARWVQSMTCWTQCSVADCRRSHASW